MRIAVITPYLVGRAGGERHVLDLAYHLQQLGHEVTLYCYAANPATCYGEMMEKVHWKSVTHGGIHGAIHSRKGFFKRYFQWLRPYYEFFIMWQLGRLISDCDVVLHLNQPSEWAAYWAKARLGVPAVWICNEPPFYWDERIQKGILHKLFGWPIYHIWDRLAARRLDRIVALSELYKKYIDRVYGAKSEVIYEAVHDEPKSPAYDIRTKFKVPREKFIALFIGTFVDYKRPQDAIEALAEMKDAVLFLIGEGDEEKYERVAEELHVSDRAVFVHRLNDEELEAFYQQCDVVVFTAEQSWGLVIPEAFLRKKPVITCPLAGASEIVRDGVNGFVVPPRSPERIAEKMKWLKNHPEEARKMGEEGCEWVKENLSYPTYAKQMADVLEAELSRKRAKPPARK